MNIYLLAAAGETGHMGNCLLFAAGHTDETNVLSSGEISSHLYLFLDALYSFPQAW